MKTATREDNINLTSQDEGACSIFSKAVLKSYSAPSPTFSYNDTGTFATPKDHQTDIYFGLKTTEKKPKIGTDEIVFDELDGLTLPRNRTAVTYTDSFLKLKTAKFVSGLKGLLEKWEESMSDPSELKFIKDIFNLIEENSRYLSVKPNNRLVLGTIQNFFLKWAKLEKKQISHFSSLLEWFKEGDVPENKVRSFNQEVFLTLKRNYVQDTKKEE